MQDQEYVVWETAEDERVCNYCGPLDLKIVSTEEMGGYSYPPAHVNCRCTVAPVSDYYDPESIRYYHSQPKAYDEADLDNPVKATRIELFLVPYFRKGGIPE